MFPIPIYFLMHSGAFTFRTSGHVISNACQKSGSAIKNDLVAQHNKLSRHNITSFQLNVELK